jgi:hypothetical protein
MLWTYWRYSSMFTLMMMHQNHNIVQIVRIILITERSRWRLHNSRRGRDTLTVDRQVVPETGNALQSMSLLTSSTKQMFQVT